MDSADCDSEADEMTTGKHRDLQRVTVPYARFLNVLDGRDGDLDMTTDI